MIFILKILLYVIIYHTVIPNNPLISKKNYLKKIIFQKKNLRYSTTAYLVYSHTSTSSTLRVPYQELVEIVKLTQRRWNTSVKLNTYSSEILVNDPWDSH